MNLQKVKEIKDLEKKYEELGAEIERLKAAPENVHEALAKVMPNGVLCQTWSDISTQETKEEFRRFNNVFTEHPMYFIANRSKWQYIHFPTKPIIAWLGESDKPPVYIDSIVRVWFRNGIEKDPAPAHVFRWEWLDNDSDIIAYCVEEWA